MALPLAAALPPTIKQEAAEHLAAMMSPRAPAPAAIEAAPTVAAGLGVECKEPQAAACPCCAGAKLAPGQKTRRRRKRKGGRHGVRLGRWWRKFGYSGPAYCQRCSEVFRDHIVRQLSNTAECSRDSPCGECAGVLAGFVPHAGAELWAKMDAETCALEIAKREAEKRRTQTGRAPGATAAAAAAAPPSANVAPALAGAPVPAPAAAGIVRRVTL